MECHLHESHVRQVAIVTEERATLGLHFVATIVAKFNCGALPFDGPHEVGSVKVATSFAGNEEYFHIVTDWKEMYGLSSPPLRLQTRYLTR